LAIGIVVMFRSGVSAETWIRNLAATGLGVLMVLVALGRRIPSGSETFLLRWLIAVGVGLLGATLMGPDVAGVHRWLGLGPQEIHVGAVLLPSLLVFLTDLEWTPAVAVALLTLTVLLLQPDAAQAASFAAGWGVWMAMTRGRKAAVPVAAAVILGGATWLRHDPLEPVPHVEGIVGVAAGLGTMWRATSLGALTLLPIPFLLDPKRHVGTALAVYMTGTLVAAWLGHYPIPVLGYGVSPIFGYYLAIVALSFSGNWGPQSALAAA
jgi:hypothetical protein